MLRRRLISSRFSPWFYWVNGVIEFFLFLWLIFKTQLKGLSLLQVTFELNLKASSNRKFPILRGFFNDIRLWVLCVLSFPFLPISLHLFSTFTQIIHQPFSWVNFLLLVTRQSWSLLKIKMNLRRLIINPLLISISFIFLRLGLFPIFTILHRRRSGQKPRKVCFCLW